MDLSKIAKKKYIKSGELQMFLSEHGYLPVAMLTEAGKKIKREADKTIAKFAEGEKDQQRKNFVEQTFANMALKYCGTGNKILAITGPNILKHVELYMRSSGIADQMHVPEINPFIYFYIVEQAKKCWETHLGKITLHLAPVQSFLVPGCHVIDLDLMQTLKETEGIIKGWLEYQAETVKGNKVFTFTTAVRAGGSPQIRFSQYKRIFNKLDATLIAFDGERDQIPSGKEYAKRINSLDTDKGKYCFERLITFSNMGRIQTVKAFHYADGCGMLSVCIVYK